MIVEAVLTAALLLPQVYTEEDARADIAEGGYDTVIAGLSRVPLEPANEERLQLLVHALRMRSINAYRSSRYQTALTDLQRILQLTPWDTRPRQEIAVVYAGLASEFIARSDTPASIAALQKALQYDPGRRDVIRALAFITLQSGKDLEAAGREREAIGKYRRALEIDSEYIEADLYLGRLYYDREEFALAKLHLEHARDVTTGKIQGLDELLARVNREFDASRTYTTVEMDGFLVRFEGAERYDLFYQLQPILTAARNRTAMILERKSSAPLAVILYTGGDFSQAVTAPDWAGGIFDGKIRIRDVQMRNSAASLEKIVRHEVAHAVLESVAPGRVPGWVHEGFAKYMEGNAWDPPADVSYLLAAIRDGRRVRLAEIHGSFTNLPAGADVRLAYAQTAAAVRHLVAVYGEPVIADLVTLLATGRTIAEAIDSLTFYDIDTFQSRVNEWVVWEYGR